VSRVIDDLCGYRLPWGFNSLGLYLGNLAEALDQKLPDICQYYSAFVKFGVHDAVACWLLTYGVPSRRIALSVARLLGGRFASPDALLAWLLMGGIDHLITLGIPQDEAQVIRDALQGLDFDPKKKSGAGTIASAEVSSVAPSERKLKEGDRLLIHPNPTQSETEFTLYNLMGEELGVYEWNHKLLASFWNHPEYIDVVTVTARTGDAEVNKIGREEGRSGSPVPEASPVAQCLDQFWHRDRRVAEENQWNTLFACSSHIFLSYLALWRLIYHANLGLNIAPCFLRMVFPKQPRRPQHSPRRDRRENEEPWR
jgi:hypothetical protein